MYNKISWFSVPIINHCGFIIKFYKTDLIHSNYGHNRQLEQKINENICQHSACYISNGVPIAVCSGSLCVLLVSKFPFNLSATSYKMGKTHMDQFTKCSVLQLQRKTASSGTFFKHSEEHIQISSGW